MRRYDESALMLERRKESRGGDKIKPGADRETGGRRVEMDLMMWVRDGEWEAKRGEVEWEENTEEEI